MYGSHTTAHARALRAEKLVSSVDSTNAFSASALCSGASVANGFDDVDDGSAADDGLIAPRTGATNAFGRARSRPTLCSACGALPPPRENTAPESTSAVDTGSITSTSYVPHVVVVPSTRVPAAPFATRVP